MAEKDKDKKTANKEAKKLAHHINVHNRKAAFEYELLDEFDAGIILVGSEVKSIRLGNVSISEAYCYVTKSGVVVKNMHIQELKNAAIQHEPLRERMLLLTKKEVSKLRMALQTEGLALVPTLLFSRKGLMKLKLRLGKGKKLRDKRESIKEKDIKRDTDRELNG